MAVSEKKPEQKTNRVQWFVFVILIPFILAVTVTLIVMTVAGVNVFEKTKNFTTNIPVLSQLINSDSEESSNGEASTNRAELRATIEDQKAQIQSLNSEINSKDQAIEELNAQIATLTEQLNSKETSNQEKEEVLDDLSSSFKDMDPERAAAIVSQLDQSVSISLIKKLPSQERGRILAAMSAEQAAIITSALVNGSN